jgi:phosphoglycerate dehydrogenase-like enzyme
MGQAMLDGKKVLITLPVDDDERAAFESVITDAGGTTQFKREMFVHERDLDDAYAIVGNVPARLLHAQPGLAWLQTSSAGYDHYLAEGMLGPDTRLSCAAGTYGQAVSEHMFAQLLCLMKKLHLYRDNQHEHLWHDEGKVRTLKGAHVLVIGAGDIGTHFATLCAAMGAHVTEVRRSDVEAAWPYESMATIGELFDIIGEADVVASVLPSTDQTRGMADADFFAAMREGSYFVNAGRGDLVVSEDLLQALRSGHLAGVALEVTNPEPLPADHPLWDEPNALITPHISGFWHLPDQTHETIAFCLDNLKAFLAGEPLANEVAR